MTKKSDDFTFEIKEHYEDLTGENEKGWKTEFNLVSFNGGEPKYDIRPWNADHSRMGKGIALTYDEIALLYEAIQSNNIC